MRAARVLAWPIRRISSPKLACDATKVLAVCRRSWNRSPGTPAVARAFRQVWLKFVRRRPRRAFVRAVPARKQASAPGRLALGREPAGTAASCPGRPSAWGRRVRLRRTRPRAYDEAAPDRERHLGEWNAYWESQFEAVRTQLGWLKSDLKEGHAELRGSINDGSRALAAAERKNAEYVRTVVAGDGGKGLTRTWWASRSPGAA